MNQTIAKKLTAGCTTLCLLLSLTPIMHVQAGSESTLPEIIENALDYTYSGYDYNYHSVDVNLDDTSGLLNFTYTDRALEAYNSDDTMQGVAHDLVRYLGALYRTEIETVEQLIYDEVEYVWDSSIGLLGSNWVVYDTTTTLASVLAMGEIENSITLTLVSSDIDEPAFDLTLSFEIEEIEETLNDISSLKGDNVTTDLSDFTIGEFEEYTLKLAEFNEEANNKSDLSDLPGEKSDHVILMPSAENIIGTMIIENMTVNENDILVLNGISNAEALDSAISSITVSDGEGTYKTFTLDLADAGIIVFENVINGPALASFGITENGEISEAHQTGVIDALFGTTFISTAIYEELSTVEVTVENITDTSADFNITASGSIITVDVFSDEARITSAGTVDDFSVTGLEEGTEYFYTVTVSNLLGAITDDGSFETLGLNRIENNISEDKGENVITNLTTLEVGEYDIYTLKLAEFDIEEGNKSDLDGDRKSDHTILMPPMSAIEGTMIIENLTGSEGPQANDILVLNGISTAEELDDAIDSITVSDGEGTFKTFTLDFIDAGIIVFENVINGPLLSSAFGIGNGTLDESEQTTIVGVFFGTTFVSSEDFLAEAEEITIQGDVKNIELLAASGKQVSIEGDTGAVISFSGSISVDGTWDNLFIAPKEITTLEGSPENTFKTFETGGDVGVTITLDDEEVFTLRLTLSGGVVGRTYSIYRSPKSLDGVFFNEIAQCTLGEDRVCEFTTSTLSLFAIVDISTAGSCGVSDGQSFTSAPTTNLCAFGIPTSVVLNGNTFSWSCEGINGGATNSCSATRTVASSGGGGGGGGGSIIIDPQPHVGQEIGTPVVTTPSTRVSIERSTIMIHGTLYPILMPTFSGNTRTLVDRLVSLIVGNVAMTSDHQGAANQISALLVGIYLHLEGDVRGMGIIERAITNIRQYLR
ncbi:hypothetical protein LAT59_03980 [Candidatus Gracilibacteria bacterium]|nr:hypothetical protein [Candidatus Gracilibacteria bacterium]